MEEVDGGTVTDATTPGGVDKKRAEMTGTEVLPKGEGGPGELVSDEVQASAADDDTARFVVLWIPSPLVSISADSPAGKFKCSD